MSWDIGQYSQRQKGVGNTILTIREKELVKNLTKKQILFVRKIQSDKPDSVKLREFIDQLNI